MNGNNMNQTSLKNRLMFYLIKHYEWFNGGVLERLGEGAGYKASNVSRRLRELHEEGRLEREERRGEKVRSVWYRWKKPVIPEFIRTEKLFT